MLFLSINPFCLPLFSPDLKAKRPRTSNGIPRRNATAASETYRESEPYRSTSLLALMKYVKGRDCATTERGQGRTEAGYKASDRIMSVPAIYEGTAHSNLLAKMAYDPSKYPRPNADGKTNAIAATKRATEAGEMTSGKLAWKNSELTSAQTAIEITTTGTDSRKEAMHLPVRYGIEEEGVIKTWG